MEKLFKYVGYVAVSLLIAWLSTLGKEDYIEWMSHSIVQLLIALLALYSTISSLLISRILSFKEVIPDADINPVVEAMRRNVRIESILILVTLFVIILSNVFIMQGWLCESIVNVVRNLVVVFSLLYFVIVVYDTSMGLYDLLQFKKNNKK